MANISGLFYNFQIFSGLHSWWGGGLVNMTGVELIYGCIIKGLNY